MPGRERAEEGATPAESDEVGASRPARVLLCWQAFAIAAGGAILTLLIFGAWPRLDLAAARLFYEGAGRFIAQEPAGEGLRRVVYWVPSATLMLSVLAWAARRWRGSPRWAPSTRGVAFLVLSFLLGPGLLVNVALKGHSHRPRPVQTEAFGGTLPFRPVGRFDGACRGNCSFVSGEGSAAAWMLAPAMLSPPAVRAAALAGAVVFAILVGILRMAAGGHYLSDTILAALFTVMVLIATWRAICRDVSQRSRLPAD